MVIPLRALVAKAGGLPYIKMLTLRQASVALSRAAASLKQDYEKRGKQVSIVDWSDWLTSLNLSVPETKQSPPFPYTKEHVLAVEAWSISPTSSKAISLMADTLGSWPESLRVGYQKCFIGVSLKDTDFASLTAGATKDVALSDYRLIAGYLGIDKIPPPTASDPKRWFAYEVEKATALLPFDKLLADPQWAEAAVKFASSPSAVSRITSPDLLGGSFVLLPPTIQLANVAGYCDDAGSIVLGLPPFLSAKDSFTSLQEAIITTLVTTAKATGSVTVSRPVMQHIKDFASKAESGSREIAMLFATDRLATLHDLLRRAFPQLPFPMLGDALSVFAYVGSIATSLGFTYKLEPETVTEAPPPPAVSQGIKNAIIVDPQQQEKMQGAVALFLAYQRYVVDKLGSAEYAYLKAAQYGNLLGMNQDKVRSYLAAKDNCEAEALTLRKGLTRHATFTLNLAISDNWGLLCDVQLNLVMLAAAIRLKKEYQTKVERSERLFQEELNDGVKLLDKLGVSINLLDGITTDNPKSDIPAGAEDVGVEDSIKKMFLQWARLKTTVYVLDADLGMAQESPNLHRKATGLSAKVAEMSSRLAAYSNHEASVLKELNALIATSAKRALWEGAISQFSHVASLRQNLLRFSKAIRFHYNLPVLTRNEAFTANEAFNKAAVKLSGYEVKLGLPDLKDFILTQDFSDNEGLPGGKLPSSNETTAFDHPYLDKYGNFSFVAKPFSLLHVKAFLEDFVNQIKGGSKLNDQEKAVAREFITGTLSKLFSQCVEEVTATPVAEKCLALFGLAYPVNYGGAEYAALIDSRDNLPKVRWLIAGAIKALNDRLSNFKPSYLDAPAPNPTGKPRTATYLIGRSRGRDYVLVNQDAQGYISGYLVRNGVGTEYPSGTLASFLSNIKARLNGLGNSLSGKELTTDELKGMLRLHKGDDILFLPNSWQNKPPVDKANYPGNVAAREAYLAFLNTACATALRSAELDTLRRSGNSGTALKEASLAFETARSANLKANDDFLNACRRSTDPDEWRYIGGFLDNIVRLLSAAYVETEAFSRTYGTKFDNTRAATAYGLLLKGLTKLDEMGGKLGLSGLSTTALKFLDSGSVNAPSESPATDKSLSDIQLEREESLPVGADKLLAQRLRASKLSQLKENQRAVASRITNGRLDLLLDMVMRDIYEGGSLYSDVFGFENYGRLSDSDILITDSIRRGASGNIVVVNEHRVKQVLAESIKRIYDEIRIQVSLPETKTNSIADVYRDVTEVLEANGLSAKFWRGSYYLTKPDGVIRGYANNAQAKAMVEKLAAMGVNAGITARHPFNILIYGLLLVPSGSDQVSAPADKDGLAFVQQGASAYNGFKDYLTGRDSPFHEDVAIPFIQALNKLDHYDPTDGREVTAWEYLVLLWANGFRPTSYVPSETKPKLVMYHQLEPGRKLTLYGGGAEFFHYLDTIWGD